MVSNALDSLSKTNLNTLAIKVTQLQTISELKSIMKNIFTIRTLKKLSFACDSYSMRWEFLTKVSSNIEKLTICGVSCDLGSLRYIFECALRLKYLHIRLTLTNYLEVIQQMFRWKNNMALMSTLHTLILDVQCSTLPLVNLLKPFLRYMSSLYCLEIKTYDISLEGSAWETLLETSLPMLTSFNLIVHANSLETISINSLLESLQTPLWIERKNFNVIIIEHQNPDHRKSFVYKLENLSRYPLNQPVGKRWIQPLRELKGNLSSNDKISSLHLSPMYSSLLQNHYVDNVNHLVLPDVNDELLEWMIKYINCSRIRHLDIILFNKISSKFPLLLSYNRNNISLRMKPSQLLDYQNVCLENNNCLKFLDISVDQHSFNEIILVLIAKLFPNIEHLVINTQDLRNVPMLQFYLPCLRSLTFKKRHQPWFINNHFFDNDDYPALMPDENIRRQSQFLFHRETQWITVWIDEAALQDSFWQIIDTDSL